MFDILSRDFKNAPLWQKVLLLILLGILFYHLFVKSGLDLFSKKMQQLDRQRDSLFRQLQTMQYLVADKNIIEKNYEKESRAFLDILPAQVVSEVALRRTFKVGTRSVLSSEFALRPEKDFGAFYRSTARFQALVFSENLAELLSRVDALPGVDLKNIDYQNKILNIELWYFYRKTGAPSPIVKKAGTTAHKDKIIAKRRPADKYSLQGFYTNNSARQAIINDRLFGIGEKCGKYTIIGVEPENKVIKIKADGRIRTIRSGQRF